MAISKAEKSSVRKRRAARKAARILSRLDPGTMSSNAPVFGQAVAYEVSDRVKATAAGGWAQFSWW